MFPSLANKTTSSVPLSPTAKKLLINTFGAVGLMQLTAAVTCVATLGLIPPMGGAGVAMLMFALLAGLSFAIHALRNSGWGVLLLFVFAAITGAMISPMVNAYLAVPQLSSVLFQALAMTAASAFGVSAYAIVSRKDFSFMGGFLFAGALVVIGAALLNLFVASSALGLVVGAAGALVFTLYLLYNVSNLVNGHETNYVSAAISVYVNIFNMFQSFLSLLSPRP